MLGAFPLSRFDEPPAELFVTDVNTTLEGSGCGHYGISIHDGICLCPSKSHTVLLPAPYIRTIRAIGTDAETVQRDHSFDLLIERSGMCPPPYPGGGARTIHCEVSVREQTCLSEGIPQPLV